MLSSSVFSQFSCPDNNCNRPYCQYNHEKSNAQKPNAPKASISTDSVPSTSSSVIIISQEETPIPNDTNYVGYYSTAASADVTSTITTLGSAGQAYDPFSSIYGYNSTSYAPEAPTTSFNNTNSYNPEFNSYNQRTTTTQSYNQSGGFTAADDAEVMDPKPSNISPHKSKKGLGFTLNDEVMDPAPSKRTRKDSSDFVDPSKPILPPDLGNDEILQFGKQPKSNKAKEKHEDNYVSKKAKKPTPKVLVESQLVIKSRAEEANKMMKNVAAIDRELNDMAKKRKQKFEENMKKSSFDVDALFEVDEPPPRKIAKTSSSVSTRESADSVRSNKPLKIIPSSPQPRSSKRPFEVANDDDIIVISQKPPPPQSKGTRVAHQPTASVPPIRKKTLLKDQLEARQKSVANAKPPPTSSSSSKHQSLITTSFSKGAPRVAHVPKPSPAKPKISEPPTKPSLKDINSRKVPIQVRQRILDKLVTEFVQFMPRSDAIVTAQNEEHDMLTKSATRTGYCSSVSGIIKRAREMANNRKISSSKSTGISHLDLLKGKHAGEISVGVNKHVKKNAERVSEYCEAELYDVLFDKYIMTNEQLEDNGYPLWVDETKKDLVRIKTSELDAKSELYVDPNNPLRVCCRCKATYRIKLRPDDVVENSDCVYHWGKFWKKKVQAQWIPRYTCCDMGEGVPGCSLGKQHVTQMQTTNVFKEFVEAPPRREDYDERSNKIFALDCEMVYTSLGPAVARLSVVDYRGDKILDEIIRPPGELLDTNFRFSGLEEDEVLNANLDLTGAQERFFEIINRDTILIGHSLESDLKSMRIVHKNVIDTSVLFPHRLGPPYKRALKNLSSEILMEIIQEDVTGHDSAEDAQIALKLVLHKLKNE